MANQAEETAQWIQEVVDSADTPVGAAPKDDNVKAATPAAGKTEAEKKEAKAAKRRRQKDRKAAEKLPEKDDPKMVEDETPPSMSAAAASGEGDQERLLPPGHSDLGTSAAAASCAMVSYTEDKMTLTPVEKVVSAATAATMDAQEKVSYDLPEPVNDEPRYTLNCANAKECGAYGLKWSRFMLVPETSGTADASWSGVIWGHCQPCSGYEEGPFKREARRQV